MSIWNTNTVTIITIGNSGSRSTRLMDTMITTTRSNGNTGEMRTVRVRASTSARRPVSPPPFCPMTAALPYCEVNCASSSPVDNQLAPVQVANARPMGHTRTNMSRKAKPAGS